MKILRLVTIMMLAAMAPTSDSHATRIELFSDSTFTDSTLVDLEPRHFDVYVVHKNESGGVLSGSDFSVAASSGFDATYLGDSRHAGIYLGTTFEGISVGYGTCAQTPVLAVVMSFFGNGTSQPCSYLEVAPHPEIGAIVWHDCVPNDKPPGDGGRLWVNCTGPPVPTEESTWGRIKDLYTGE